MFLLFSLSVPTIIIIALSAVIINSASSLSLVTQMFIFSGILLLGFLDIIITYSLFAMIQDRVTQSYIKINKIGVPKISLKVSFVPLEQTEEYKNIALLGLDTRENDKSGRSDANLVITIDKTNKKSK